MAIANQALALVDQTDDLITDLCRKAIYSLFSNIKHGRIRFIDAWGTHEFGNSDPELDCTLEVHSSLLYRHLILRSNAGIAAGESYMEGHWTVDSLVRLVRLMIRNKESRSQIDSGPLSRTRALLDRALRARQRNSLSGSKRNILAHYDLGNAFYELFLDETMSYSCAYFAESDTSLYDASIAKIDLIASKLKLEPTDHLLEIGTGWGALAIRVAQMHGCKVTTTTISDEQYCMAQKRVAAAGLQDLVSVLKCDYRHLTGQYDKIVSVEMIEAVGYEYLDEYLAKCCSLLAPGGLVAIQAITMPDQEYDEYLTRTDFIQRYVFPGSHLPCVSELMVRAKRSTQFRLVDLQEHGLHYAQTLKHWREAFLGRLDEVRAMGFDDQFMRQWEFYLAYCEGAFAESYTGCCQLVFQRHMYS